jgi:hypothetical protein
MSMEVITNDAPGVLAVTPIPTGLNIVPNVCGVRNIRELAVTAVVFTVAVPPIRVATPINVIDATPEGIHLLDPEDHTNGCPLTCDPEMETSVNAESVCAPTPFPVIFVTTEPDFIPTISIHDPISQMLPLTVFN